MFIVALLVIVFLALNFASGIERTITRRKYNLIDVVMAFVELGLVLVLAISQL